MSEPSPPLPASVRGWTFEVVEVADDDGGAPYVRIAWTLLARWTGATRTLYEYGGAYRSREAAEAAVVRALAHLRAHPKESPARSGRWAQVRPDREPVAQATLYAYLSPPER